MLGYNLVLTDRAYTPVAELRNVADLTYFRGLSKLATCSFKVKLNNPQIARLAACDGFIKVFRKGILQFVGPIVTAQESTDREAQSLAVNCADQGWVLAHRIAGKSATGTLWTTVTARHTIAKALIDQANTDGETGVNTGAYTLTSGSSITYKAGPYVNLMTAVTELGAALDGFDWLMRPIDNWVNGALAGSKVAGFQAQTLIGSTRPTVVFEYGPGTRSNVLAYNITTTRDQQADVVYYASSSDVVTGTNATAQTAWGLLEDVVQGEITDATMRQKVVNEHVTVRGTPRTLVSMTPHIDPGALGRVPEPFVEYDVGDTITFRAINQKIVRFSGALRVYGITATVENTGFERIELTLEDDS